MKRFSLMLLIILVLVLWFAAGKVVGKIVVDLPNAIPTTTQTHDSCRGIPEPCYDYTVDIAEGCIIEPTGLYSCSTGCGEIAQLEIGTPVYAACQENGWCIDLNLGGYLEKEYVGSCEQ